MSSVDPNQPLSNRMPTENQYPQPGYSVPQVPYYTPPSPPIPLQPPYGQQPQVSYQITDRVERQVSQTPLLSLISSITSWPFFCTAGVTADLPVLSFILAVGSITLGHVALARTPTAGKSRNSGLAIAGLIIGYLTVSICLVWVILRFRYYQAPA